MRLTSAMRIALVRNKLLTTVIAITFFSIIMISAVVAYAVLLTSPDLMKVIEDFVGTTRTYAAIPPPFTKNLYFFIFLNNIGHFWNPARIWAWVPFIGAFSLGYELLLNAITIGAVASFVSITKGAAYTIAGLTPHGVFELPAFVLEFAGLARWHVATTRALYGKLGGRGVDRPLLVEGVKDALMLSLMSVALFAIAAYFETYVTPRFLGL
ncbi:MAG: stage II sporulation protein M [Candidatus Bathyarchaeia archaeon]